MSKWHFLSQQRWFWGTAGLLAGVLLGFVLSQVAHRQANKDFKGPGPAAAHSEPSRDLTSKGLGLIGSADRQNWGLDPKEVDWAMAHAEEILERGLASESPKGNLSLASTERVRQLIDRMGIGSKVSVQFVRPVEHPSDGFEIDRVPSGSILEERGFRVGDIVRNVNGKQVRNCADLLMRFQALRAGEESVVRIVVDRAGELMIVEYR